jgi:hypothetical protein
MKKWVMLLLLIPMVVIFAQDQAKWEPAAPDFGDTLTITLDPSLALKIPATATAVKLHWGINEKSHGDWQPPNPGIWPEGSVAMSDGKAIESPMTKTLDGKWTITIATVSGTDTVRTLHFVMTDGANWENNNNANWDVYFGGLGPPPKIHTAKVMFNVLVDVSNAVRNRGFTYGDTLEVRFGYFNTAKEIKTITLLRQTFSSFYAGGDTVITTLQDTIDYSYYAIKNGKPNWEVYFNFDYYNPKNSEAQYRRIKIRKRTMSLQDTVKSNVHPNRPPFFRNMNVVARDVLVTLTCDLRPAYYHLLLGGDPLIDIQPPGSGEGLTIREPEEVLALGVAVNGPITGTWGNSVGADWGPHLMTLDNKVMYDDGTHGDAVIGDTIYATQYTFYKDSSDIVGQEFKFGIGGGDNESGFGNNHVANIDDFEAQSVLEAQFGSIYPVFYTEWDYDKKMLTAVEFASGSPETYVLGPNYPNPFNPVTSIRYTLPKSGSVSMRIYNAKGELVNTLVDGSMPAGEHRVSWDGADSRGMQAGTGLYFCRFEAGSFSKTLKMMIIR